MRSLSLVVGLLMTATVAAERALVLVHKEFKSTYAVEGEDFTVQYNVVNTGDVVATNVIVSDPYPVEHFTLVDGETVVTIDSIQPGVETQFNITVKPETAGVFNSARATVEYEYEDEDETVVTANGFSTSLGKLQIISSDVYLRATSHFVREWTTFGVMACGPLLVPMVVWLSLRGTNNDVYSIKKVKKTK